MNTCIQQQIPFTQNARRDDPHTSIDAARKVERNGTTSRHERLILQCLKTFGPLTAKEMEEKLSRDPLAINRISSVEISRRSGGLIHTKPYRCQYTGTRNGFKIWSLTKDNC